MLFRSSPLEEEAMVLAVDGIELDASDDDVPASARVARVIQSVSMLRSSRIDADRALTSPLGG